MVMIFKIFSLFMVFDISPMLLSFAFLFSYFSFNNQYLIFKLL